MEKRNTIQNNSNYELLHGILILLGASYDKTYGSEHTIVYRIKINNNNFEFIINNIRENNQIDIWVNKGFKGSYPVNNEIIDKVNQIISLYT